MHRYGYSTHIMYKISKLQFADGALDILLSIFVILNALSYFNALFIAINTYYIIFILPRLWHSFRAFVTWPSIGYASIQKKYIFYGLSISMLCAILISGVLFAVYHQATPAVWVASRLGTGFHGYLLTICSFMLGVCWALPRFLAYAFLLGMGTWFLTVAFPAASPGWALAATGLAMLAIGGSKCFIFYRAAPTPPMEAIQPPDPEFKGKNPLDEGDRHLLLRFLSHLEAANVPFLAKVTGLSAETVDHQLGLLAEAGLICTMDRHEARALSPTATLTEKGFQQLRSLARS